MWHEHIYKINIIRNHIPELCRYNSAFAAQGNALTSQERSLQWMAFTEALPCKAISENDNFRKAILVLDDCYNEDDIKTLQR